jgi:hypothetical protein
LLPRVESSHAADDGKTVVISPILRVAVRRSTHHSDGQVLLPEARVTVAKNLVGLRISVEKAARLEGRRDRLGTAPFVELPIRPLERPVREPNAERKKAKDDESKAEEDASHRTGDQQPSPLASR